MATGSLGQLTIDLAANITRFERSLTRAEQLAQNRSRTIQRTFTKLATGIGVAFASFGLTNQIKQSLQFADTIGKTADKLGIATDSLQEYRFAAEQTGVNIKALDVGIQRFIRRVGEAAEGEGVLKNILKELNIELRDSNGAMRSSESILLDYADAIKNAESSQERLRLANKAFDTEGVALVNLFKGGREAVQGYATEAQKLGIILREDTIRNAEKANDAMNRLNKIFKVGSTEAFASAAPLITEVADALKELIAGDVAKLPEWAKTTALSFKVLGFAASEATGVIGKLGASVALLVTGEGNKIAGLWAEARDRTAEASAELDAYVARLNTILTPEDEEKKIKTPDLDVDGGAKKNILTDKTKEEMDADYAAYEEILNDAARAAERNARERAKSVAELASFQKSQETAVLNNSVALLSALGSKQKGFALAALAIQKAAAIAQTVISTRAAIMKSYEIYGDTPAGWAAQAHLETLGAVNVGLIAATGLAQASNINSGSAAGGAASTFGTSTNPITTVSNEPVFATGESSRGGSITINVNGVVTEEIMQDLVIPAIQDATDNKDIILFHNDSRQALELTN